METKKNITEEYKLKTLYHIQLIDSRIDEIQEFRKSIPVEMEYMEKELKNIKENVEQIRLQILYMKEKIEKEKKNIQKSEELIKKYEKQKNKIRNNKELYYIDKEVDYQKLEIQLSQKKIKEFNTKIKSKNNLLEDKKNTLKNKEDFFSHKRKELNNILSENQKEKNILLEKNIFLSKKLDNNILDLYKKIRSRVKNGIAVAPVQRGAPLGSYLTITPQKYSELIQRNKLLIDEHSGRILIDFELAEEEKNKLFVELYKKKKI
ncbi:zinc ribbon domain-containing protein [Blattabacterium cuenoti]|uniref:zinc ribbon domain-containing protein n=1 Tax=Blattabacterium cuenoti TaxID=1653831 RepID=UPI00163C59D0|nr:hypothetical protein [Blattabacterium cuenoti]